MSYKTCSCKQKSAVPRNERIKGFRCKKCKYPIGDLFLGFSLLDKKHVCDCEAGTFGNFISIEGDFDKQIVLHTTCDKYLDIDQLLANSKPRKVVARYTSSADKNPSDDDEEVKIEDRKK